MELPESSDPLVPTDQLLRTDAPMGGHGKRLKHLDGIRGLAAFAVVCSHYLGGMASYPGLQQYIGRFVTPGWLGVDVFFPLSGFLITGILLEEPKEKGYFSRFYIRRAFRLMPLYYAYLAVLFLFELVSHEVDLRNLLANAFYVQNIYDAWMGHWPTGTGLLWSLAVEEQFYLLWPLLIYRLQPKTMAKLAIFGGLGSFLLRVGMHMTGYSFASYVLIVSHMDGLCLGALCALLVRGVDPINLRGILRKIAWPAGAGVLLMALFMRNLENGSLVFGSVAPLLTAVWTSGVILRPGWGERLLTLSPLRWLGKYSYAIYVLQFMTGILFQHWLFRRTESTGLRLLGMAVMFALLLVEARISWAVLEGPVMRLRERLFPTELRPAAASAK